MNDIEKENREYKEFLEFYHKQYEKEERTEEPAVSANSSQAENADRAVQTESEACEYNTYSDINRRSIADKARKQTKVLLAAALAALILIIVLIVCLCTRSTDALKGTWDLDGVTAYRFDGKGAGSLNLPSSSYAFTYEIKDGTLAIDFESEAAQDKTYTFTAYKNKLTLTDIGGAEAKAFELTKQKN